MNPLRARRPEALWLLAAGTLLVVLLAWAAWTVVQKHNQATAQLAEIEPRHARVAGMLQSKDLFEQADNALQANLAEFAYPVVEDAGQTGNNALQRVRELAGNRGLRVTSSQAATPREDKSFDRIGLSLRVEGDWPAVVALLGDLARQKPAILTNTLQLGLQGGGPQGSPQIAFGQLDLYVLKERRP